VFLVPDGASAQRGPGMERLRRAEKSLETAAILFYRIVGHIGLFLTAVVLLLIFVLGLWVIVLGMERLHTSLREPPVHNVKPIPDAPTPDVRGCLPDDGVVTPRSTRPAKGNRVTRHAVAGRYALFPPPRIRAPLGRIRIALACFNCWGFARGE
jgi:hypothetical protein